MIKRYKLNNVPPVPLNEILINFFVLNFFFFSFFNFYSDKYRNENVPFGVL